MFTLHLRLFYVKLIFTDNKGDYMKYIAKISLGFKDLISESAPKFLKGAGCFNFYRDLAEFEYGKEIADVLKYPLFSTIFIVLYKFSQEETSFRKMSEKLLSESIDIKRAVSFFKNALTFRVRYYTEKGLVSVDDYTKGNDEKYIHKHTGLKSNKLDSDVEFYYISRHDKQNYFAVRLGKAADSEKQKAGEIKLDVAYAVAYKSDIQKNDVILDPFSRYGVLPFCISKFYKDVKVYAGDYESNMVSAMKERGKRTMGRQPLITKINPSDMVNIENETINKIITEMPSAKYENATAKLYLDFLKEALRVIKPNGSIYLLVQEPELLNDAIKQFESIVLKNQTVFKASKTYNFYQLKKK